MKKLQTRSGSLLKVLAGLALTAGLALGACDNGSTSDNNVTNPGAAAAFEKDLLAIDGVAGHTKVSGDTLTLSGDVILDKALEVPEGVTFAIAESSAKAAGSPGSGIVFGAPLTVFGTVVIPQNAAVLTVPSVTFTVKLGGVYNDSRAKAANAGT